MLDNSLDVELWQICPFIEEKSTFQNKHKSGTFDIRKRILNCSSNLVVYLIECNSCSKQHVGSTIQRSVAVLITIKVWLEKCQKIVPRNVMSIKNNCLSHFNSKGNNGMEGWEITIIDRAEYVLGLRRRESCWQHRLNMFISNGLKERFFCIPML